MLMLKQRHCLLDQILDHWLTLFSEEKFMQINDRISTEFSLRPLIFSVDVDAVDCSCCLDGVEATVRSSVSFD